MRPQATAPVFLQAAAPCVEWEAVADKLKGKNVPWDIYFFVGMIFNHADCPEKKAYDLEVDSWRRQVATVLQRLQLLQFLDAGPCRQSLNDKVHLIRLVVLHVPHRVGVAGSVALSFPHLRALRRCS